MGKESLAIFKVIDTRNIGKMIYRKKPDRHSAEWRSIQRRIFTRQKNGSGKKWFHDGRFYEGFFAII